LEPKEGNLQYASKKDTDQCNLSCQTQTEPVNGEQRQTDDVNITYYTNDAYAVSDPSKHCVILVEDIDERDDGVVKQAENDTGPSAPPHPGIHAEQAKIQ
jgi:hypothetical protein